MAGSVAAGKTRPGAGCLALFGLPFALVGVGMAISVLARLTAPGTADSQQIIMRVTMALVFGGSGIGLIYYDFASRGAGRRTEALMAKNPDKPWLWREDWSQGYAEPESKSTEALFAGLGALMVLITMPLLMNLREALFVRRRYAVLIGLAFPLAGVYLICQSLIAYLRDRRFRARLSLSTMPGVAGGHLNGRMEVAIPLPGGTPFDLTLSCVHSYVSGSGNSRSRWQTVLWQDKKTATPVSGGVGSEVPVEFVVPYDSKETDNRNPDDAILWRLSASASLPGLDFRATFVAPVFKTAASDPSLTAEKLETQDQARQGGVKPAGTRIATRRMPDGGAGFYLGPGRTKALAGALSLFGAVFLAGGVFFGVVSSQAFGWVVGFFPLTIAGGMGVLLLAFAVWLWFGATTVEVINRDVHMHSKCLGFSRSSVVPGGEIQRLELYPGMQQGDKVWYDLRAHLANGRTVTMGSGLEKAEAEWYLGEMKKDLALN
jgi:hypothetical protein